MTKTATPLPTTCENHDVAGECTQECADLISAMSGDSAPYIPFDPTGCSYPEPKPYDVFEFDAVNKRVVRRTIDPEDETLAEFAARASVALNAYRPGLGCGPEVDIASLIADLLTYAEVAGYGAASTLDLAKYHYTALDGGTL